MIPEEVIKRLAEVASAVAHQAGVGGMETAGMLVSILAAHPEKIPAFMAGELDLITDPAMLRAEMGCLSWHAVNGRIVTPAEFRAARSQGDH